jgi:hypothetical protein
MESTGRFTPALRRLVYHSYDRCGRCGAQMDKSCRIVVRHHGRWADQSFGLGGGRKRIGGSLPTPERNVVFPE